MSDYFCSNVNALIEGCDIEEYDFKYNFEPLSDFDDDNHVSIRRAIEIYYYMEIEGLSEPDLEKEYMREQFILYFGHPSDWNTSEVTDMSGLFSNVLSFNENISEWDVSRVKDMSSMFWRLASFNQDLSRWNVSNVEDMRSMFCGASSFNQNINQWNVSNVENMSSMFKDAKSFNQDLDQWDVGRVFNMCSMFHGATNFDGKMFSNTQNVVYMNSMFEDATNFNNELMFDTQNVEQMQRMFYGASSFNQNIGHWNVGKTYNFRSMFYNASSLPENFNLDKWFEYEAHNGLGLVHNYRMGGFIIEDVV